MTINRTGRKEADELSIELEQTVAPLAGFAVYTTRPETLLGVTYVAVAAQHPIALEAAKTNNDLAIFIEECKNTKVAEAEMATMEKKGYATGYFAIHPLSGDKVPVWVANFVLMGYGSGAVMAVPGHDQRDWEFATKYGLEIKQVIQADAQSNVECDLSLKAFTEKGLLLNSGEYDDLTSADSFDTIAQTLIEQTKV